MRTEIEHLFSKFWEAYPSKASERNAREAYERLVLVDGVPANNLLDAARNYSAHCRISEVPEKYVKHAANWLKESVYVDYLPQNWKGKIVEYKKPANSREESRGSTFSCSRREYDYEELERRLLVGGG